MIEFLGRDKELSILHKAIRARSKRCAVVISGAGGIGKTRLLQELDARYRNLPRTRILDIIDFDLPANGLPQVIGRTIASAFPGIFGPYLNALYLRKKVEEGALQADLISPEALNSRGTFVTCFNAAAQVERIVLRFDTIEKVQGRLSFNPIIELLPALENVVVVFASRPQLGDQPNGAEALYEQLKQLPASQLKLIYRPLKPFDPQTLQEYVEKKQVQVGLTLDPDWSATLVTLADGRPVLIDLAVELGNQPSAADWLIELKKNHAQLHALSKRKNKRDQAKFAEIQARFEREIVAGIIDIRDDLDLLAILLALIAPLNRASIAAILKLEPDQIAPLFEEAGRRVSFKVIGEDSISLHDVMRDLIRKYVIPEVDPIHDRERTYLQRAIETFEQQSETLRVSVGQFPTDEGANEERGRFEERNTYERDYQQMRIRIVEFMFRLDPVKGLERLEQELKTAHDRGVFSNDLYTLADIVQAYLPASEQESMTYIRVQMLLAAQYVLDGQYSIAETIYSRIEPYIADDSSLRFEILDSRGDIQMGIGEVQKALNLFRQALALAEKLGDSSLRARGLLPCAWASRTLGRLDWPIDYYQEALKLAMSRDIDTETSRTLRARALNGLAYVYAIRDNRREALGALKEAITIRQSLGPSGRLALGQSYATAGEVYNELEEPEEALRSLDMAESIFNELYAVSSSAESRPANPSQSPKRPNQWLAKVFSARGRAFSALWASTGDAGKREEYLRRAEAALNKAVELAIAADLPSVRQRLGFVYAATPEKREKAVKTWLQGYHDAQRFGDLFTELNNVCQLAYMAVYGHTTEEFPDLQAFDAWYTAYLQRNSDVSFDILQARFATYRGCLALQHSDVETAVRHFREGLGVLVERNRQSSYTFDWQLRFLEQDVLPGCKPEVVRSVWKRLLEEWMAQGKGVAAWAIFERWQHWPI